MTIELTATAGRAGRRWFRYDAIGAFVAVADVVIIVSSSLFCGLAYRNLTAATAIDVEDLLALGGLFAALFLPLVQMRGLYRPIALLKPLRHIGQIFVLWAVVAGFLMLVGFALKMGHTMSRAATISFMVCGVLVVIGTRLLWRGVIERALASGAFATRRIAIFGDASALQDNKLARQLAPFGLTVVSRVEFDAGMGGEAVDVVVREAVASLRGSHVEEVIVAFDRGRFDLAQNVVAGLRILPLPIRLMLDPDLGDLVSRPTQHLGQLVSVEMHRAPMTAGERGVKRALDVVIAGSTLFLFSPLLVLTALAIRLDSPGPVLFRQSRNGFNNRSFKILKFRSMRVMEEGVDVMQASRHDSRVTAVGKIIRRLSVDELPQLWNVIRGDMSIVGPRPHAIAHDTHYEKLIGDYPYRQHVKPGLTGWAQVNGSRGETPTINSMERRVELDIWYVENSSIWLDFVIMARTSILLRNVKDTY